MRKSNAGDVATPKKESAATAHRPHLYEVDLLRAVTALAVVAVHVTSFTVTQNQSQGAMQAQNAVVALLHFTREIFLSITALVLVYGYAHRPFSARAFWRKRGIGVLLPYVLWSLLYSWLNQPHDGILRWSRLALLDILTGSASFQLYFILLTLQVYLILPALLWLLDRFARHPWRLVIGSCILEVVLLCIDFYAIQSGPLAATRLGRLMSNYQGRYLPLYQLYVILGAVAALHIEQVRAFVLRHGYRVIAAAAAGIVVYLGRYFIAVRVQNQSVDRATSVFQPTMALYATTTALFLYWLGTVWAKRRKPGQPPSGFRFWGSLSQASFGIYLIHPLFLTPTLAYLAPILPAAWPVGVRVFLLCLVVGSASALASVMLLRTPLLRFLVGRALRPAQKEQSAAIPASNAATPVPHDREGVHRASTMASVTGDGT